MSTDPKQFITVRDLQVEVVRKEIKNLHLGVYPPAGRVRVAVPLWVDDEAVRLAIVSHIGWIRRQQAVLEQQVRQSQRQMVTGESHFAQGRRYRLRLVEREGRAFVRIVNRSTIELTVSPEVDRNGREAVLHRWYRRQLRASIPALISKWEPVLGVQVADWGIRKMKTRWGSCNIEARRIWLNLELAKKPANCLEYVVVHEMVHLLERHHGDRFRQLMSQFLPQWHLYRDELNRAPLAHEDWDY